MATISLDPPLRWRVYDQFVDVSLLYFEGCPNWEDTALSILLLSETFEFKFSRTIVNTIEDAERHRFTGSPTIHVNGIDPFGGKRDTRVGLSCRIYDTPDGRAGGPTLEMIRQALQTAVAAEEQTG